MGQASVPAFPRQYRRSDPGHLARRHRVRVILFDANLSVVVNPSVRTIRPVRFLRVSWRFG